ncbi:MAG TPA: SDR family NAD(P)-dependent oxidoreductase [Terriglobales bacterium]|nr:SDR family NAD(P)-dependent oxidoreductase [Terriglobales bacterium]
MNQPGAFAVYPSLRDRTVLITGGASGIGAALVEQFALQGSRVAFLDLAAEAGAELVKQLGGRCAHPPCFSACDLTDIAALRAAIGEIEARLGAVRILINNAASDDRHSFSEVTPEYWDERMAVNLRHQFFATQAVVPGMKAAGGGSVINMSSISWVIPSTGLPVYVVAKAAIVGMTRTLAHELGAANIRVNCVMPGAIATERQRRLWYTPEYRKEIMSRQALKRELVPEDVARLVMFLASDDSSAITSQSYVIDGGWV